MMRKLYFLPFNHSFWLLTRLHKIWKLNLQELLNCRLSKKATLIWRNLPLECWFDVNLVNFKFRKFFGASLENQKCTNAKYLTSYISHSLNRNLQLSRAVEWRQTKSVFFVINGAIALIETAQCCRRTCLRTFLGTIKVFKCQFRAPTWGMNVANFNKIVFGAIFTVCYWCRIVVCCVANVRSNGKDTVRKSIWNENEITKKKLLM